MPPPIGGVTIHVQRLMEHLNQHNIELAFVGKKRKQIISFLLRPKQTDLAHIHFSKGLLRLILVYILRIKNIPSSLTIHRNLGRETGLQKRFTHAAISASDSVIVLNNESLEIASKINPSSQLISSFFPPSSHRLDPEIESQLQEFKSNKSKLFCTNAYDFVHDENGKEIYQISKLVQLFSSLPQSFGLIISDPTGNNYRHIQDKESSNIFFITKPHDFVPVIKLSNCLIRATTTDGDSISVKEALFCKKNVLASDCVSRPESVTLYQSENMNELKQKIIAFKSSDVISPKNAIKDLIPLYHLIAKKN